MAIWPSIASKAVSASSGRRSFALSLAVVTQAGCLQDRGKSRDIHGLIQIAALRDRREQCRFGAELPRHGLFQQPVLGDFKGFRSGPDCNPCLKPLNRLDRHVLELIGDDIAQIRQLLEGCRIIVIGDNLGVGDLGGRGIAVGLENDGSEAQPGCGSMRQHAAQLAAAEDADDCCRARVAPMLMPGPPAVSADGVGPGLPAGIEAMAATCLVCQRQDGGGHEAGVDGAGLADGEGADGYAAQASGRWRAGCRGRTGPWTEPGRRERAGG
jgi:hypothetical protein